MVAVNVKELPAHGHATALLLVLERASSTKGVGPDAALAAYGRLALFNRGLRGLPATRVELIDVQNVLPLFLLVVACWSHRVLSFFELLLDFVHELLLLFVTLIRNVVLVLNV